MYTFDPDWLAKLDECRSRGVEPFPNGFTVTHSSTQIHSAMAGVEKPDEVDYGEVRIGGRMMSLRTHGKTAFLDVQDAGERNVQTLDREGNPAVLGGRIQVMALKRILGEEMFGNVDKLNRGDIVWVRGKVIRTRVGELTIMASEVQLASKIMRPFPDTYHGVNDAEFRARQRYVDLFMNHDTRETFRLRSKIVRNIRNYFEDRGFLEVETPMLQVIPGGAAARPFITHHNALDMPLYLRIAPELYLKRLIVGGFDKVFEINRSYRNEGVSVKHNPEFTMLEFYWAWATFTDLMDLTEQLIAGLCTELLGTTTVQFGEHSIDFGSPWRRADMDALIAEHTGIPLADLEHPDKMEAFWRANHKVGETDTLPSIRGKWWELLFDTYVERKLVNPTFVTGFPTEISPLSRRNDVDPSRVDRFELIIATWEIANAFSELNDPVDQAERFAAQASAREAGDEESMYFDADYVRALSYGMPPTAGQGIGIDRLVMLLTGKLSIREVILFPTLRPESSGGPATS